VCCIDRLNPPASQVVEESSTVLPEWPYDLDRGFDCWARQNKGFAAMQALWVVFDCDQLCPLMRRGALREAHSKSVRMSMSSNTCAPC
jgi:hypothetical protein